MDKTRKIIHMTEHPDQYSEDELRQLLIDDDEGRKIYRTICEINAALELNTNVKTSRGTMIRKIAAVFVGVCLLSGLAYAAVSTGLLGKTEQKTTDKAAPTTVEQVEKNVRKQTKESAEPTVIVKTYEDVTLKQILTELAAVYHLNVNYKSAKADGLRLYFRLDTRRGLEKVIEDLNSFDNINITKNGDTLTVD